MKKKHINAKVIKKIWCILSSHKWGDTHYEYQSKNAYVQYKHKCLRCGKIEEWEVWDEDIGHNPDKLVTHSKGIIQVHGK